ncbi:MAG: hypothetical protein ACYDDN_08200, partial [Candidatus Desulforudaceae bacterium]
ALDQINVSAPVAGRFYVLAIGRTGRPEHTFTIAELEFYLLPQAKVDFPRRLHAFDEQPTIEINQEFPGNLTLEKCRIDDPDHRKWVAPVGISRAKGFIECENIVVAVEICVHRAGVFYPDRTFVRYLLEPIPEGISFIVTGLPDSEVEICLYGTPSNPVRISFDEKGLAQVTSEVLSGMASDCGHHIAELVLISGEDTVSTGALIVDSVNVIAGIYAGTGFRASVSTAQSFTAVLELCTRLCRDRQEGKAFNLTSTPRFHPRIDDQVYSIFACAMTFDGVDIRVSGRTTDWTQTLDNPNLRSVLRFVSLAGRANRPVCCLPEVAQGILPPVGRWKTALEQLLSKLESEGGIPGLTEWNGEITDHRTVFRSTIGLADGGHSLSSAWVRYHRGQFQSALSQLSRVTEGPLFVTELRDLLYVVLLLRLARFEEANHRLETRQPGGNLQSAFTTLHNIIKVLIDEEVTRGSEAEIVTGLLPLRLDDRVLVEAASGTVDKLTDIDTGEIDTDWLLLLYLANSSTPVDIKARLTRLLLQYPERIPLSPDKGTILERLYKQVEGYQ